MEKPLNVVQTTCLYFHNRTSESYEDEWSRTEVDLTMANVRSEDSAQGSSQNHTTILSRSLGLFFGCCSLSKHHGRGLRFPSCSFDQDTEQGRYFVWPQCHSQSKRFTSERRRLLDDLARGRRNGEKNGPTINIFVLRFFNLAYFVY